MIQATVELEGRTIPPATDFTTLLDVHLRLPGSTVDIDDANYVTYNDDDTATSDTVEVDLISGFPLILASVPAGRYVLTIKDTSHVSGRTDTITVRDGETVDITGSVLGFFGSDLRGDPTFLLPSSGAELIAGDVSEDNEINEDDVNLIIAAWGSDDTAPSFEQADINNDQIVSASDLTVTTSNFGNSQGFGAPPVFKRGGVATGDDAILVRSRYRKPVPRGDNADASLELRPLFDIARHPQMGDVVGFEVVGIDLDDVAGYEFEIRFEEGALRILPERTTKGDVFDANPYGSVFQSRAGDGELQVISSRIGKEWTAQGEASLVQLWFEVLDDDGLTEIELGRGVLLDPIYRPQEVSWKRALAEWLLPTQASLEQNYPNPFNPSTIIPIAVPVAQAVRLDIYNVLGQRIRTLMAGQAEPGFHTIVWNGRDDAGRAAAAGLYISVFETPEFRQTRKMLLVK